VQEKKIRKKWRDEEEKRHKGSLNKKKELFATTRPEP
jgi:hypothetical protein